MLLLVFLIQFPMKNSIFATFATFALCDSYYFSVISLHCYEVFVCDCRFKPIFSVAENCPMFWFQWCFCFSFPWHVICLKIPYVWLFLFSVIIPHHFCLWILFYFVANLNLFLKLLMFLIKSAVSTLSYLFYNSLFDVYCLLIFLHLVIPLSP